MRNKKGQITWFIIAGIVMILAVGVVFYVRQIKTESTFEATPPETEVRYEGEQEIRSFVDSCLRPIVLQGLEIQRLQGGYIDIPDYKKRYVIKDDEQVRTMGGSKKVFLEPAAQGNEKVFWVTKYGLDLPSKPFLEKELETYVNRELDLCLNDFENFHSLGYSIEQGRITTKVSFAKSTWVKVNMPLTVDRNDIEYEISDFNIEIPINMELIYNIASDLASYEDSFAYTERFSLDLIDKYQWIPGSPKSPIAFLPPRRKTDVSFDCQETTWTMDEVETYLKENYQENFQYLKVADTSFERETRSDPTQQGVFDSYIYDFFDQTYPTIHVDYSYDTDWFFNFDILPKSGELIKPDRTTGTGIPMLPRICTLKYRFNYFYDFPILLKIKDDKSARIDIGSNTLIQEGGYEFHLLLHNFVCGNQKRECTGRIETPEIETPLEDTDFCEPSQRLSGDIKINIMDNATPVEDVDIYYFGANSIQNCFMGTTNETGSFASKFPFCTRCSLQLYKQDYPVKEETLSIEDYQDKELTYDLSPFADLDVLVKYKRIPIFVRSFHETGGFTDATGIIKLAKELGFDTTTLNPVLDDLLNNKALMQLLTGEVNINPTYDDLTSMIATGLNPFYYLHPDVEDAKLKLGQGKYTLSTGTTATVNITNTSYGGSVPMGGFTGTYPLGPEVIQTWNVDSVKDKTSVIFYSLVEYTSSQVNPGSWHVIDDPIMDEDTMLAELLYEATPIFNPLSPVVNCMDDWTFKGINGRGMLDYNPGACRQVWHVNITKQEYLPFITPELK